jgi:hypothetical protein
MENGSVGILNVGAGDTKLTFDDSNPAEAIRAARIVKDMLRRGYALLVEVDRDGKKAFERALDFREDVREYIIADFDPIPVEPAKVELREPDDDPVDNYDDDDPEPTAEPEPEKPRRGRPPGKGKRGIKASETKAIAVSRSAGG